MEEGREMREEGRGTVKVRGKREEEKDKREEGREKREEGRW